MFYNLADQKINKLCRIVLIKTQFTQIELESLGFVDFEIKDLEKANIIYKIVNDYYFIGVDLLFQYGMHLLNINLDLATSCFEKCIEIDSHYQKARLGLFFINLKKRKYDQAYEILTNLLANDKGNLLKNDNLYFKILSNIHLVPKQLQEKLNNLRKWDVMLESENKDLTIENDIRLLAYWQRYRKAITRLTKLENANDLHNMIFKELLYQILWQEKERDYYVVDCIKDKNYEELVHILRIEESFHSLSKFSYFILYLSQIYLNLKNTGRIPPIKKDVEIKTSHDAIMAYDYKKALELALKEDKDMGYSKNISSMILKDICALLDFYENSVVLDETENNLFYGIKGELVLKVKKAVLMGLDYQKIISSSDLSEEEQDIMVLILAQDFYKTSQYELVDKFLNIILNKQITFKVNLILEQTLKIMKDTKQSKKVRIYKKESQN